MVWVNFVSGPLDFNSMFEIAPMQNAGFTINALFAFWLGLGGGGEAMADEYGNIMQWE